MAKYVDSEVVKDKLSRTLCLHEDLPALIDSIPAADVRPVVLGKWEHFGSDVFRCSECGYGILPWNVGVNFCPNCGAEMRPEPPKEE